MSIVLVFFFSCHCDKYQTKAAERRVISVLSLWVQSIVMRKTWQELNKITQNPVRKQWILMLSSLSSFHSAGTLAHDSITMFRMGLPAQLSLSGNILKSIHRGVFLSSGDFKLIMTSGHYRRRCSILMTLQDIDPCPQRPLVSSQLTVVTVTTFYFSLTSDLELISNLEK